MKRIAIKSIVSTLILLLHGLFALAQKPEIGTIDRVKGSMDDLVSIRGTSFGTDVSKLVVSFGATRGTITSLTNQLIQVRIPSGTTYKDISVTNISNGLSDYASEQFLLSFSGIPPFNASNLTGQENFVAGLALYDHCLCDLNNDSKADIVATNSGENSISILRNNSVLGNFDFVEIPLSVGARTLGVKCGDLNGDGLQDIVLTQAENSGTRDQVFILKNTGGFTFSTTTITLARVNTDKAPITAEASIADLDRDGKPEILITDEAYGVVRILVNKSTPTVLDFSTVLNVLIPDPDIIGGLARSTDGLAVEDLNADGLPDIVTSQYQISQNNLYIVNNQSTPGTISFGATTKIAIGNSVKRIRIGDLDGDRKPDIAVTQLVGHFNGEGFAIFRNTGSGAGFSFSAPTKFTLDGTVFGLDFGDMDGDGKTDITVAYPLIAKLLILNNASTPGTLVFTPIYVPTAFGGRQVCVGDLDGDGKPDVSYTEAIATTPARVGILRNKSCVLPVVSPVATPITLCDGILPYKLTATASRGSFYQWTREFPAGTFTTLACGVDQNTLDVTAATGSGVYRVKILAEGATCSVNTGCALESTGINITIIVGTAANSNPTYNNGNGPVCIGSPLSLSIANVIAGAIYKWSGPEGYAASGATQTIPNFQLKNAGTYYVDVVLPSGCTAKQESVVVEAIDVPTFTINADGPTVLCAPTSRQLSVVPTPTGFSYQWFKDGTSLGSNSPANTTYTVAAAPASSGNYTVKASYSGCTTIETAPLNIRVASVPVATFTFNPPSACANQKVIFTNTSTVDGSTTPVYNWNFGDGQSSTLKDPEHIFTTASAIPYDVTLTVSYTGGACPSAPLMKQITVTSAPSVSITNPDNKYSVCEGSTLVLEVLGTFTSYTWSTGATTPSITVTQGGTYSVDVTTVSCTLSASRVVTELDAPEVIVSATPDQINEGQTSQLEASGLTSYTWSPVESLNSSTIPNPVATPLQTTTYTVTGLGSNNCEGMATIIVKVAGEILVNKLSPGNFFSPNNDGPNEVWEVGNILDYPQCGVVIYDDKGVKVFDAKPYQNDWNGTFNGKALPDGVYFYIIRCDGEEGTPRTGSITLIR